MEVLKVLNNSTALVLAGQQETIVMGNGIAFGIKAGGQIDPDKVEKRYTVAPTFNNEKFQALFEKISYEDTSLAFDLISYFQSQLEYPLSEMIYLSLADHISYAIERAKDGIYIPNAVLHEVQMFYPKEYQLGQYAVAQINESAKVALTDDEAGFIALHIINAHWDAQTGESEQDFSKIINDLLAILKTTYQKDFAKDSINFHRLVTHLKYFLVREFKLEHSQVTDFGYFDQVINDFPEAYTGAEKINEYFMTFFGRQIPKEEKVFLTIHINRFLNN